MIMGNTDIALPDNEQKMIPVASTPQESRSVLESKIVSSSRLASPVRDVDTGVQLTVLSLYGKSKQTSPTGISHECGCEPSKMVSGKHKLTWA